MTLRSILSSKAAASVCCKINLSVPKGSFVSLIGPSGCGKSTLLNVLAGLIVPSEGGVSVDGIVPQEAAKTIDATKAFNNQYVSAANTLKR
jgi:ABC-type sugar transport system ATPase subunit